MLFSNQGNAVCKASSFEEPGAVIPHAGICEGGQLGNWLFYLDRYSRFESY
jgi:hypothetical protein